MNIKSRITIGKSPFERIRDLTVGQKAFSHFLLQKVELKETNDKRSHYLDVVFMDPTGTITAKWWGVNPTIGSAFTPGQVVYVTGSVKEYKDQLQLTIDYMAPSTEHDPIDFVQRVTENPKALWLELQDFASQIVHLDIANVIDHVLTSKKEQWLMYPAAISMHHQVAGGLLFHTVSMLRLADRILDVYRWLQRDLLYAGIILHDAGKMRELAVENGIASARTTHGQLIGHIVEGALWIERMFVQLKIENDDIKMVLQHLVLAHHEKAEWGSPVNPQLPEAFMLCMIDNMDARMYAIEQAVLKANDDTFSEPIKMIQSQRVYRFDASYKERP